MNRKGLMGLARSAIKTIYFFSAVVFSFLSPLKAQQPYLPFRHLSNASGLSQNHVLSILQDQKGFMWFGTSEGLNRFDGYEFTVYRHLEKDSTSLPSDHISALIEDHNGDMWIGSGKGLSKYNRETNSFTSYVYSSVRKNGISRGRVSQILEDAQGNFWLGFVTGFVDYFDRREGVFIHHHIFNEGDSPGGSTEVTSLQEDHLGNLWIGSNEGITVLNYAHQVETRFMHHPNDPNSLSSSIVNDIFRDSKNNIWIATEEGLNRFNNHDSTFIRSVHNEEDPNSLGLNVVKCLEEDKEGRLWIGTENGGLDILDRTQNKFYHFKQDESSKTAISDNSIYSIFRDKHDNMWVGTNSKGVDFYDRFMKTFVVYQSSPGISTNLSHNKVSAIVEQPNKGLWIGTDGGGLNFFDPKTGLFNAYRYKRGDLNCIQSDFVVDVIWDSAEHCVWIATWGEGLSRLDPVTGHFTYYRHNNHDATSIPTNNLWRLYQDNEGTLYVGTYGGGLSIYDKKTNRFHNYSTKDGLAEKNVISIFRDHGGVLWLGSWGRGISRFDLSKNKFIPTFKGIGVNTVLSISEDSLNRIWFSGSPGIVCYNGKSDRVFSYTVENGLPGSIVNDLLDDHKGNFWLSTNKGIAKFNVLKNTFEVFTVEDGLPTNQFASRLLLTADGKMCFGSVDGLVIFYPDQVKKNPNIPPVVITDLKIFNKSVPVGAKENILSKSISETKEIWLPFEYNFISLSFVALNYTSTQRNQYAYKLEGFDEDWVNSGTQRFATYTSLDPGTYVFRVKASNNDGLWNEGGVTLTIHVLPPWWQTLLFRIIFTLTMVLAAVVFYNLRVRVIKKQNRRLSELVKERTKELHLLNEEIVSQNTILVDHEKELANKNAELILSQKEIEMQNEELKLGQAEILAHRNLVLVQNKKLEQAHSIIAKQNEEIKQRNENLELEVESRTKELVAYNQQLEQFAFISAHNLRAPVATILGLGEILRLNPEDTRDKMEVFEKIIFTTYELDRVVRDLNTILEIRKNNASIISEINLDEELALVKGHIENEIRETESQIQADFSKAHVISSVKPYVESILFNLLTNAIKYRHPKRKPIISITSEPYPECICLTVADNGLGIELDLYKDKIFGLYQRFHNHVEGKGLGLYMVKNQIMAMGGQIEIESKVGEGTTFKIYFKVATE